MSKSKHLTLAATVIHIAALRYIQLEILSASLGVLAALNALKE